MTALLSKIITSVAATWVVVAAHVATAAVPSATPPSPQVSAPQVISPVRPGLSPQAQFVKGVAIRNGDQNFLMVDKIHGKITLFENGNPIFSAPALTGASLMDHFTQAWLEKTQAQATTEDRITPAGRFTVKIGNDPKLKDILVLQEIKGKDWSLAIHQLPSENRRAKLISPHDPDKRITSGCVNVEEEVIDYLVKYAKYYFQTPDGHAHQGAFPLYVLPLDVGRTVEFFPDRKMQPGMEHQNIPRMLSNRTTYPLPG